MKEIGLFLWESEGKHLHVKVQVHHLGRMYFPKTNCKAAYSQGIELLDKWKCFLLHEHDWELWKAPQNMLELWKLEKHFEVVFSSFYFKRAKGKVIFLCMCQKKSDQKGHLQLIFLLERNKRRRAGLCSLPSQYYACQLDANDLFWKADSTPKEILGWDNSTHWSVWKCNFISEFCRPVHMWAKVSIFTSSSNNWNIKSSHFMVAREIAH